jgi:hypothetical protein
LLALISPLTLSAGTPDDRCRFAVNVTPIKRMHSRIA